MSLVTSNYHAESAVLSFCLIRLMLEYTMIYNGLSINNVSWAFQR